MTTPEITRIAHVALIVDDIMETELFFEEAFDFVTLERRIGERAQAELYGVPDARIRETIMALDEQRLSLLAFDPPGRPYPHASTSSDLWFQHFAIIVSDMDAAHRQLKAAGRFTPISEDGPVVLPASSGGVTAFKFRDAEGHPARASRLSCRQGAAGVGGQARQRRLSRHRPHGDRRRRHGAQHRLLQGCLRAGDRRAEREHRRRAGAHGCRARGASDGHRAYAGGGAAASRTARLPCRHAPADSRPPPPRATSPPPMS